MKKLLSILLALMLLFSLTTTAYATDDDDRVPDVSMTDLAYFIAVVSSLDIQSGIAYCSGQALCTSSVDRIDISMYLQKYDGGWTTLKYWANRTNSDTASLDGQWAVVSGYSYRLRCYFYAYIDDVCVEIVSATSYDSY